MTSFTPKIHYKRFSSHRRGSHPKAKSREGKEDFGQQAMEQICLAVIRDWVKSLDGADKVNFSFLGMKDIGILIDIPIKMDFLRAAMSYWNPMRHTFIFGVQELCLTVEEFRVVSGIHLTNVPILPRPRFGYLAELKKLCSGTERQNGGLIRGSALDIMGLVRRFKDRPHSNDATFMGYRRHALCLCIFVGFLLLSSVDIASVRLIDVVSQFLD